MDITIKFISNKKLDRTVILDDVIYAPSDDGATHLPRRLVEYLKLDVQPDDVEESPSATLSISGDGNKKSS